MTEPPTPEPETETDRLGLALGELVRAREAAEVEARPPQWEAVLAGQLALDAAVDERREAGDPDHELDRAAAYFQPFDGEETASLVDGLLAGLADDAGTDRSDQAPQAAGENVIAFAAKPKPEPKPAASPESSGHEPVKSGFGWVPGGLLAMAAAAIALWWVWPRNAEVGAGETGVVIAQRDPLPSFALETDGGLRELRGDGDAPSGAVHRYRRDTPFAWVLRPEVSTDRAVGVRAFALVEGGSAGLPLKVDALAQIASSGSVRIAGEVGALELEPGRYTIVLVVGQADQLPEHAAEAIAEPSAGSKPPWQVHQVEIAIED